MVSVKTTLLVILVTLLVFVHGSDAWRRRRRRRCPVRDCQVGSWSYWSSCSASKCGQQGSQSRSRQEESSASCGGAECSDLRETRQCYASQRVDCQLSSWSEWSACTVPCGVSGTQHSARHRLVTEQCGGTCTSTFRKTRACPDLSCLNGGSLKDGTCFCKEGYSGNCCEKGFNKGWLGLIIPACCLVPCCIAAIVIKCYWDEIQQWRSRRRRVGNQNNKRPRDAWN